MIERVVAVALMSGMVFTAFHFFGETEAAPRASIAVVSPVQAGG